MATNPGVIILAKEQLRGTFMHHRLNIEDNIGLYSSRFFRIC